MHILVVHNRYRSANPSGENVVVDSEIDALRAAGHKVTPYVRTSDELDDMILPRRLLHIGSPVHSPSAVRAIEALIDNDRPDVLHLHNPYPLISMSVVSGARRRGVPCVQTVHNHRHTCMIGTYRRNGHDCKDCLHAGHPGPGVLHGCYRSSRPQSVVMAAALVRARTPYREIERFIALTPEIAESLQEAGVQAGRISLRPNTVPDLGSPAAPGSGFAFVGRLSQEKGVLALIKAWLRHPVGALGRLRIVGDGPDRWRVEDLTAQRGDITVHGRLDSQGVRAVIDESAVVVVPSLWPEAFPLVLLEAMSAGRALLVTDNGGLPAIVDHEIGRVVAADVDSLSAGLLAMAADHDTTVAMGAAARHRYLSAYHPDIAVSRLERIYTEVVSTKGVAR